MNIPVLIITTFIVLITIGTGSLIERWESKEDYRSYIRRHYMRGGEQVNSVTVKKVENGYIVKSKYGEDEAVFVYQKKTSVDAKVKELLDDME